MSDSTDPTRALLAPNERMDPAIPGAPWWMYRRPPVRGAVAPVEPAEVSAPADAPDGTEPIPASEGITDLDAAPRPRVPPGPRQSGAAGAGLMVGLFVAAVIAARMGFDHLGVVLFPVAGIVAALAFGRRCQRLRPDEPWLPKLILYGTLVKLGASVARYISFAEVYKNAGDAFVYDREARELVDFWNGVRAVSPMDGMSLTGSNLIRFVTGVLYYVFGQNLLAQFILFGLLAMVGSYFWYRALVDSVPYVDKRLFLIFMLFVPSIVFWPSALGKEALMQVGVGAMAWATSLVLRSRLAQAVPLALGGGMLLYLVRPHLLALVTVAAAVPYFIGQVRPSKEGAFNSRSVGMVLVGILVVFTVAAGTKYVGIDSLSLDSVEEQLDAQTASTSYGGSSYSHGGNSLSNPLFLPTGFVTVLFRPFLWESNSLFQLMAAIESAVLLWLVVHRRQSIFLALRRCRREPFLLYCMMLLLFYSATFSSLANFGLLTRQRSLVLPAIYALIAVAPSLLRRDGLDTPDDHGRVAPFVPPRNPTPSDGHSGNGHSGDGHSGNGHSGNGHSGNGHSGNGDSGNGDSGNGDSGNGDSGNGSPGHRAVPAVVAARPRQ